MPQIEIKLPNERTYTPMYEMKAGQYGKVPDSYTYAGEVVYCEADLSDNSKVRVVSLLTPDRFWTYSQASGGVPVEILPKGTVITITV
jgi:hypothetical protein